MLKTSVSLSLNGWLFAMTVQERLKRLINNCQIPLSITFVNLFDNKFCVALLHQQCTTVSLQTNFSLVT